MKKFVLLIITLFRDTSLIYAPTSEHSTDFDVYSTLL